MPTLVAWQVFDPKVDWALRRLSQRSYSSDVRKEAFALLVQWEGTPRCRMALQALVSCAMNTASPLFKDAQLFLNDCPTHDLVTLQEASRSREARRMIGEEMGERGLLARILSFGSPDYWMQMLVLPFQRSPEEQIPVRYLDEIAFPNETIDQVAPPDDRPDLWRACHMVQENLPDHMLLAELREHLQQSEVIAHPLMQRKVLLSLPAREDPSEALIDLFAEHFEALWPEIERIISLGDELYLYTGLGERRRHIVTLMKRAFWSFPEERLRALAGYRNFWTWSFIQELTSAFLAFRDDELVVSLMAAFTALEKSQEFLDGSFDRLLKRLPHECLLGLCQTLRDAGNSLVYYILLWSYPHDRELWQTYFGPYVASGQANMHMLRNYLEVVGDAGKDDLAAWLENAPSEHGLQSDSKHSWEKLTREAIIPWDLRLGRWIGTKPDALAKFLSWGYRVTDQDLDHFDDPIGSLIPFEPELTLGDGTRLPAATIPKPWEPWWDDTTRATILEYLSPDSGSISSSEFRAIGLSFVRTAGELVGHDKQQIEKAMMFLKQCFTELAVRFPETELWFLDLLVESFAPPTLSWIGEYVHDFLIATLCLWYAERNSFPVCQVRPLIVEQLRKHIMQRPSLIRRLAGTPAYQRSLATICSPYSQVTLVLAEPRFFQCHEPNRIWLHWFATMNQPSLVENALMKCFHTLVLPELLGLPDGSERYTQTSLPAGWLAWAHHYGQGLPEMHACIYYYLGAAAADPQLRQTAEKLLKKRQAV